LKKAKKIVNYRKQNIKEGKSCNKMEKKYRNNKIQQKTAKGYLSGETVNE
jgi:hypothetical protein